MRENNLELIEQNMFLPEEQRKELTEKQQLLVKEVADCYNLQLRKPMLSRKALCNYLMGTYGCSRSQAYNVIHYAEVCLGNVQPTHKNWVRQRIVFLTEQAYAAVIAKDYKRSKALTEIANSLSKAFNTNIDEGELINAQQYLEIDQVNITIDPTALNIKVSEPKQKEIDRLLKKYEIEDAEIISDEETEE